MQAVVAPGCQELGPRGGRRSCREATGSEDRSPPAGSSGRAPVGGLGDEVPKS